MAERCRILYGKRVVQIDVRRREVLFDDGSSERFKILISTLPLNKVLEMAGLEVDEPADPLHIRVGTQYWSGAWA